MQLENGLESFCILVMFSCFFPVHFGWLQHFATRLEMVEASPNMSWGV